jgi:hypothetical protein
MLDKVFIGIPQDEEARKSYLEANCDAVENISYSHYLSPSELETVKERICELTDTINDAEEDKKAYLDQHRKETAHLTQLRKTLMEKWKCKMETVKGECYKVIDRDTKMVGYYDADGVLVNSRPATKEEAQRTIFEVLRKNG